MSKKRGRLFLSLSAMLILGGLFLTACGKKSSDNQAGRQSDNQAESPAQETTPTDGVRRVSVSELQSALEKDEAVAVDVRGNVEYKLGHIKGAHSLPLGIINQRAIELPRDKLIVTYCA